MVEEVSGRYDGSGLSVGIVVSDFNETFTGQLRDGAVSTLEKCNVDPEGITVYHAPGAFELPALTKQVIDNQTHDGIICLGVVIRGETPHFDYVASRASEGIGRLARTASIPVTFGVLTTDTVEQARARSGGKVGNKGREAALAMLQMAAVFDELHD